MGAETSNGEKSWGQLSAIRLRDRRRLSAQEMQYGVTKTVVFQECKKIDGLMRRRLKQSKDYPGFALAENTCSIASAKSSRFTGLVR